MSRPHDEGVKGGGAGRRLEALGWEGRAYSGRHLYRARARSATLCHAALLRAMHCMQARAEVAGLAERVSFGAADAEDLRQFGDASFDAVTCSLGEPACAGTCTVHPAQGPACAPACAQHVRVY